MVFPFMSDIAKNTHISTFSIEEKLACVNEAIKVVEGENQKLLARIRYNTNMLKNCHYMRGYATTTKDRATRAIAGLINAVIRIAICRKLEVVGVLEEVENAIEALKVFLDHRRMYGLELYAVQALAAYKKLKVVSTDYVGVKEMFEGNIKEDIQYNTINTC
jgi:hypothetical protein